MSTEEANFLLPSKNVVPSTAVPNTSANTIPLVLIIHGNIISSNVPSPTCSWEYRKYEIPTQNNANTAWTRPLLLISEAPPNNVINPTLPCMALDASVASAKVRVYQPMVAPAVVVAVMHTMKGWMNANGVGRMLRSRIGKASTVMHVLRTKRIQEYVVVMCVMRDWSSSGSLGGGCCEGSHCGSEVG